LKGRERGRVYPVCPATKRTLNRQNLLFLADVTGRPDLAPHAFPRPAFFLSHLTATTTTITLISAVLQSAVVLIRRRRWSSAGLVASRGRGSSPSVQPATSSSHRKGFSVLFWMCPLSFFLPVSKSNINLASWTQPYTTTI
jgi:hypothetical protein